MFIIDFITDWFYSFYYFLRDYPYAFIRNHLPKIFFFVLICLLFIQSISILQPFQSPTPITTQPNIRTPSTIKLNIPFSIELMNLHINTTYQIQFLTNYYLYITQQTFTANSSTYQTSLIASNEYNFNQSLKIGLFIPLQHSYLLFSIIPIGGSN